jgi:hypothetical protein
MLVAGVAGAIFFITSFGLLLVVQCIRAPRKQKFRQRRIHTLLVWVPTIIIAVADFCKLIVLQVSWNDSWPHGLDALRALF